MKSFISILKRAMLKIVIYVEFAEKRSVDSNSIFLYVLSTFHNCTYIL